MEGYLAHYRPHTALEPTTHDHTILKWIRFQAEERGVVLDDDDGSNPRIVTTSDETLDAKRDVADLVKELRKKELVLLNWKSTANRMLSWDIWQQVVDALADDYALAVSPTQATTCAPKVKELPTGDLRRFLAINREARGVISVDTFGLWAAAAAAEANRVEGCRVPRVLGIFGSSNPKALPRCDDWVLGEASCGGPCGVHGYFKRLEREVQGQSYFRRLKSKPGLRFGPPNGEWCVFPACEFPDDRKYQCTKSITAKEIIDKARALFR